MERLVGRCHPSPGQRAGHPVPPAGHQEAATTRLDLLRHRRGVAVGAAGELRRTSPGAAGFSRRDCDLRHRDSTAVRLPSRRRAQTPWRESCPKGQLSWWRPCSRCCTLAYGRPRRRDPSLDDQAHGKSRYGRSTIGPSSGPRQYGFTNRLSWSFYPGFARRW